MDEGGFKTALMHGVPRGETWAPFLQRLRADVAQMEKDAKADPTGKLQSMSAAMMMGKIREEATNQLANTPEAIAEIYGLKVEKRPVETVLGAAEGPAAKKPYIERKCANTWCKRRGHFKEDCYMYGGGKAGKYPTGWTGPKDLHLHPNVRAANRSQSGGTQLGSANNATTGFDDLTAAAALSQEGSVVVLGTTAAETGNIRCSNAALENSTLPKESMKFYHDSGANRHIAFERGVFHNYKAIDPVPVNGFDNSLHSNAVGKGDVHFATNYDGITRTVKLTDVLHVPSARLNLVSQGCLERKGISCHSGQGRLVLKTHGVEILRGNLGNNNLFLLDVRPMMADLKDRISDLVDDVSDSITTTASTAKSGRDFYTASWGI